MVILSGIIKGTKNCRHQSQAHTDTSDPDRQGSGALSSGLKPVGVVENNPKPGGYHPGPLTNPLGNSHQSGALMKVRAHLIAHGHIRHAENGHADPENAAPDKEIVKVIHLGIFCRQLPHHGKGESRDNGTYKHIGSALAPSRHSMV